MATRISINVTAEKLTNLINNNISCLIYGHPGMGKTAMIKQAAKLSDRPLIIIQPSVSQPQDFAGFPVLVNGEAMFVPFGHLSQIEKQKNPIVFLDDLGQAHELVQKALMQLVGDQNLNGVRIDSDVLFMAASNYKEDKAGVGNIIAPLFDRFDVVWDCKPELNNWLAWARSNGINSKLISFVMFRPTYIESFTAPASEKGFTTARRLTKVSKWLDIIDNEDVYPSLVRSCGEEFATEYWGFVANLEALEGITFDKLVKDPSGIKDLKIDCQYAICNMLLSYCDRPDDVVKIAKELVTPLPTLYSKQLDEKTRLAMSAKSKDFRTFVHKSANYK